MGHTGVLELLLEAGADLERPMEDGSGPAFIAAQNGHLEALKLLALDGEP